MGQDLFSPEATTSNNTMETSTKAEPDKTQNEKSSTTEVFARRFYILAIFSIFTMEQVMRRLPGRIMMGN